MGGGIIFENHADILTNSNKEIQQSTHFKPIQHTFLTMLGIDGFTNALAYIRYYSIYWNIYPPLNLMPMKSLLKPRLHLSAINPGFREDGTALRIAPLVDCI